MLTQTHLPRARLSVREYRPVETTAHTPDDLPARLAVHLSGGRPLPEDPVVPEKVLPGLTARDRLPLGRALGHARVLLQDLPDARVLRLAVVERSHPYRDLEGVEEYNVRAVDKTNNSFQRRNVPSIPSSFLFLPSRPPPPDVPSALDGVGVVVLFISRVPPPTCCKLEVSQVPTVDFFGVAAGREIVSFRPPGYHASTVGWV